MELVSSISRIIVFLLVFFSIFLFTVKSQNKISNRLFALFLLLVALDFTTFFLNDWLKKNEIVEIFRISSSLLQMPILYFYIVSVCYSSFKFKVRDLVHLILFFIFFFAFIVNFSSNKLILIFKITSEIQYFFYIGLIFFSLKKYKKNYLESYTNPDKLHYNWLTQIITIFLFAHLFVLAKFFIGFTSYQKLYLILTIVVTIIALFVSSYFVLKALYQPQIFRGIESKIESNKVLKNKTKISSTLFDDETKEKIKLIEDFMQEKEPFLDSDLTVQKLALQMNLPQKDLSTIINNHIGKHFFDFVNEYRIKKAMSLLENPEEKNMTVLEILYEVGFNSKSSFNTAFKKYSELTPTEFRKKAFSGK